MLRVYRAEYALPILELCGFLEFCSGCSIDAVLLEEGDVSILLGVSVSAEVADVMFTDRTLM